MHQEFIDKLLQTIKSDERILGLAVGGSWISKEIDAYSDVDLVLITREKISADPWQMKDFAAGFGKLLSAFTGEHVGEPRLLICLYDEPLLHVDIKFLTIDEFYHRVEDPVIVYDPEGQLEKVLAGSEALFPQPDHQWIEDRFWTWVHYACLKIGRGELMEAVDFLAYLRMMVLGPLLLQKNGHLARGVRKVETLLPADELNKLKATLAARNKEAVIEALKKAVALYIELRNSLYKNIRMQEATQKRVFDYLQDLKSGRQ